MLKVSMRPTLRDRPWVMLLAIILIALPTAVIAKEFTDSASRNVITQTVDRPNRATFFGGTCEQDLRGYNFNCTRRGGQAPDVPDAYIISDAPATIEFNAEELSTSLRAEPKEISLLGANMPEAGEIVLPRWDAEQLGVEVGESVTVQADPPITLRVKAISPGYTTYVDPSVVEALDDVRSEYILIRDSLMTWDDVKELNALGFVVNSRDVADHPPAADQMYAAFPLEEEDTPSLWSIAMHVYVFGIYGFIATLLLLLISPVFAVASTRMTKVYALMRSQGATTGSIKIAVATYGLLAGAIGAGLGIAGGVIWGVIHWKTNFPTWPMRLPLATYFGIWAVAVIGCVISASLPAIFASRTSITAGIEGANADRLLRWRKWMAIGPVYLGVYVVGNLAWRALLATGWMQFEVLGSTYVDERYMALFSIYTIVVTLLHLLILPALALTVPAVVYALGLIRSPLSARIGARLLRRQWLKSVPVAAGVAALMFAVVFSFLNSAYPSKPAELSYSRNFVIAEVLPDEPSNSATVRVLDYEMDVRIESPNESFSQWDSRSGTSISTAIIGSPQVLGLLNLSDAERAEALQALSEGKVLISPRATEDASIELLISDYTIEDPEAFGQNIQRVNVAPLLPKYYNGVVLSEETAEALGLRMTRVGEIKDERAKNENLLFNNEDPTRGIVKTALIPSGLALVLIAGLSVMESRAVRAQNAQFYALGAHPNTLAKVGAWQAGLIATASSWLGLASGTIIYLANATRDTYGPSGEIVAFGTLGMPISSGILYAILGLIFPLVAAAVGYLFTTSPLARPRSA